MATSNRPAGPLLSLSMALAAVLVLALHGSLLAGEPCSVMGRALHFNKGPCCCWPRPCLCPDDYCRKPLPCLRLPCIARTCDDYHCKPLPSEPCVPCLQCDTYCRKPFPCPPATCPDPSH